MRIEDDPSVATLYRDLKSPASDNEYLHYINHKIGYANSLLEKTNQILVVIAGLLGAIAGSLYYYFG